MSYFDKPRFVFWLEETAIHADDFKEAYKQFQNQLYMGMCPMYYKVTDFHGKELESKTNIRVFTVEGVNSFLLKDKDRIKLFSKSTGDQLTGNKLDVLQKVCCICENDFDLEENGCGFMGKHICGECLQKLPNTVN